MRKRCRLLLGLWLAASLTLLCAAASRPRPFFAFNGVVLWSTSVGPARLGQPGTTQLHALKIHNGRMAETQAYEFPVLFGGGATPGVFLLSPNGRTVLSLQTYDSPSGATDLSLIDLASRRVRRITHGGRYFRSGPLLWSPDGVHFLATTVEDQIHVFDAHSGGRVAAADLACAPVWARDGRSIVFSRFLLDGQPASPSQLRNIPPPQRVSRQFWVLPVTGGEPVHISRQDVDLRLGPAYRRTMRVLAQEIPEGQASLCDRNQQGALQTAPDGRRAVVMADATEPQSGGVPPPDMTAPPLLDASPFHPQMRVSSVGATGVTKQRVVPGSYDLLHWSADGRHMYGHGVDGAGRRVFFAINSHTLILSLFPLGDEWRGRTLEDIREIPATHR